MLQDQALTQRIDLVAWQVIDGTAQHIPPSHFLELADERASETSRDTDHTPAQDIQIGGCGALFAVLLGRTDAQVDFDEVSHRQSKTFIHAISKNQACRLSTFLPSTSQDIWKSRGAKKLDSLDVP